MAAFLSAGGYHHHIGANIWNSRGAGPRPAGTTGLAGIELLAGPGPLADIAARLGMTPAEMLDVHDPWGTRLVFEEK